MKDKRICFFVFLSIILLTGCSLSYDIDIAKDLTVKEKFNYNDSRYSIDGVIEDNFIETYEKKNYTVIELLKGFQIYKSYSNINAFVSSSFANTKIGKLSYDNSTKTLNIIVNKEQCNRLFTRVYEEDGEPNTELAQIKITSEVGVASSNSDTVSGNTYIWNFNKNNCDRSVNIVFNDSLLKKTSEGNNINNNDNNNSSNDKKDDVSIKFNYLYLVLVGVIVAIILLYLYVKNNKSNEV